MRHPASEYGYWRRLQARLGTYQGRSVLIIHEEGSLEILDLRTGEKLRSIEIPNRWEASAFVSAQKLHARGPIGLTELTCEKFIVKGNGHTRDSRTRAAP